MKLGDVLSLESRVVKKRVEEFLKGELEKAVERGDVEVVAEVQKARKLIDSGAKKLRRVNPYIKFMRACLVEGEKAVGKKGAIEKMRRCSAKWRDMSQEEKKRFATAELTVIDYV